MYLVTTAAHEFWPTNGPVWLLSPGCAVNLDDPAVADQWDINGIVSDPFKNGQDVIVAYAEITRITNDLIGLLANRLNVIHNTNHSERYWRIHIGFWALFFVSMVFDRRARLLKAKSEIDDILVIGCNAADIIIPADTLSFCFEAKSDFYNCQIYAFLCGKLEIPFIERRSESGAYQLEKLRNQRISLIENILDRTIAFCYSTALATAVIQRADVLTVSSYLPAWFQIVLSFVSGGRVFPLRGSRLEIQASSPLNHAARAALSAVPEGSGGIAALVISMVGMCIPKSVVEEYPQVCSRSDKLYKNYRPKAIYSANSWWFDEPFKHWAAICQEHGTKLIGGEHGPARFLYKHKNHEMHEISISDYYLTWGWADAFEPKVVPVPANTLIGLPRLIRRTFGDSILYVCTAEARHNVGALEDFSGYLEWQKRFFVATPHDLINKFVVRAHYHDYGWKIKDRLLKVAPTLRFDSWEVSLKNRLRSRESRVYVFDYISTTFAQSLSSNVPTILFWDAMRYPINETTMPHLQALKDARILHDSPESAAAWVAHIYTDPERWFRSDSCQKAVKEFCHHYARTSETPLRDWKRTFEMMVGGAPLS